MGNKGDGCTEHVISRELKIRVFLYIKKIETFMHASRASRLSRSLHSLREAILWV